MFQRWMCALTVAWLAFGAVGTAQDRATVQMRDGSKFEGRIEELTANGELFVRVSQDDQRRVPVSSVALIDKVGGASGLPDTEIREATGPEHLLLLAGGASVKGRLVAIRGGQGSANENMPRTYVFQAAGGERSYPPEQVSRIYLGAYPFAPSAGSANPRRRARPNRADDLETGVETPGAIHVAAAGGWVATGMPVRKGEWISFSTTGEVQLSANPGDRAHAAGTTRSAPGAPLPTVNAGALIGRVGNSAPFGIGDQAAVPMPFDGVLFLAVNDDERSDNRGEFIVSIRRGR
jgi:hypothetical protein